MERGSTSAETFVFFCREALQNMMLEQWGKCEMVLQQFIPQKTLQPCIYRFHRNARNVYRAECISNRSSIASDAGVKQAFLDMYNEVYEEFMEDLRWQR